MMMVMHEQWCDRLDMLGPHAERDALKAHLVCCPLPNSGEAEYLRQHLSATREAKADERI